MRNAVGGRWRICALQKSRLDGYTRMDLYTRNSDGSYKAPTGFYTRLVRNPDGTFTEFDRNKTRVDYRRPDATGLARMHRITDRNSNPMSFEYDELGRLVRVIDTLGRPIIYRYDPSQPARLTEVEDFIGRKIRFTYDQTGDFVAVTSPAVTGTPNGNDFPAGKTTRYGYSSGFTNAVLNHNLISITAPNEVASGGPPRVRIRYDRQDRVERQTLGGINERGVPAGGNIRYGYRRVPRAGGDINSPVSQTTVWDRDGSRTEYQFNRLGNIVRIREFTNRDMRTADPPFFETRYEYNQDGELVTQILPEGNRMEYEYDDDNPDRFQQGNVLKGVRIRDAARGGDQARLHRR